MDIREGTLVLVAVGRLPKTSIEKFTPGIVKRCTNLYGHCSVRFGSAFPEGPNAGIEMHKDSFIPLLMLPKEEWGLEPQEALQRHYEQAVRNLAMMYIDINSSLQHFLVSIQGES